MVDMAAAAPMASTDWQLSIDKLAHPSGIDLGPLEPSCPERL